MAEAKDANVAWADDASIWVYARKGFIVNLRPLLLLLLLLELELLEDGMLLLLLLAPLPLELPLRW
jgi:hypothetical protein